MDESLAALNALNEKLDLLSSQVQYLTEQAELASRRQTERAELVSDVTPIVNDVFQLATEQLQEVQEYIDLADVLRFLKRLLRNGRNFDKMLDQVESLTDLAGTVGPLTDSVFEKATDLLQTAEHKGYFAVARGGARVVDDVVTSLSAEDLERFGQGVALLLPVLRDLTQPETLAQVRAAIADGQVQVGRPVDASLPSLLAQMRDPNVRRGLALTLRVLGVVGARAARTVSLPRGARMVPPVRRPGR